MAKGHRSQIKRERNANKGPTMKRIRARAQGRAYRIEKRMSHITLVLDER